MSSKMLLGFLGSNLVSFGATKKDKIKRDFDKGGIPISDVDIMIKALRLAWIPRLLNPDSQNWKSIPDHFFKKIED